MKYYRTCSVEQHHSVLAFAQCFLVKSTYRHVHVGCNVLMLRCTNLMALQEDM